LLKKSTLSKEKSYSTLLKNNLELDDLLPTVNGFWLSVLSQSLPRENWHIVRHKIGIQINIVMTRCTLNLVCMAFL
ncbi:hypothetical protein, partial [Vibrio parahaemolyticus]|uniref:hypothetical protein n=1 Tax=Vibrio parahaemolyticus TaxID=670 RepID=UPI002112B7C6